MVPREAAGSVQVVPGAPHVGAYPLDDQGAEFRNYTDDDYKGAAQWAASIDLFAERDVLDADPVQLIQHFEEVLHRTSDPVAGPDQDHIELAVRQSDGSLPAPPASWSSCSRLTRSASSQERVPAVRRY